ncbi:protein delta homolog 2 [Conger conger]|uniref:protein delta homolog 2 n=1 Tax=Conger conger TaxID=82655 RepID=UPI002A5A590B|nr:protein delta homolog 2 [Conger conger]XP_061084596.1 protein delta homolog 2 [Conger conger]
MAMDHRLTLSLLVWSCGLLVQNCTGQEEECQCNLSHGRCDESGACRCDPGWEGPQCDDCARMPGCVHGSCHQPWQCTCESGWAGRFCDKDVYVCTNEQPCKNGATCFTNDSGDYSCFCPEGFHGKNCEMKTGPCQRTRSPCKNGGLCEDSNGFAPELSCRCLAGFVGARCEEDVDDCLMRPCANGASCVDGVNRFSCECPAGFSGRFCTVNDDDCAGRPCRNGGRCLDRVAAFQCLCPPGFDGPTCEGATPWRPGLETRPPTWVSRGWTGGGAPRGNASTRGVTAGGGGERLLKISVKEVVTQRDAGLTEVQLVTLLVLGGMTLAVVALTAALVMRGHWQDRCGRCNPPQPRPDPAPAPAQQECKISFLHEPSPKLEKKRHNTQVI